MVHVLKHGINKLFLAGAAGAALAGCAGAKEITLPQTPSHPEWVSDAPWAADDDYRREVDMVRVTFETEIKAARADARAVRLMCKSEFEESAREKPDEALRDSCLERANGSFLRVVKSAIREEMRDWVGVDRRYREEYRAATGHADKDNIQPLSDAAMLETLKVRCQKAMLQEAGGREMPSTQKGLCADLSLLPAP